MGRSTARLVAFVALIFALGTLPVAPAGARQCANRNLMPTEDNRGAIRSATRCLLNKERRRRGRRPLRANGQLRRVAQAYAEQMVRERFFAHVSPAGSTLLSRIRNSSDYLARRASYSLGENLAWGTGSRATPRQTVLSWMRSPGHRRNILDRGFRDVGVGVAVGAPRDTGGHPAATYTTEFGARSSR